MSYTEVKPHPIISLAATFWVSCLICLISLSFQLLSTTQIVKNDSQTVAAFKLYSLKGSQEVIACCTEHEIICGFRICI